jgi:hypothetical protein
MATKSTLSPVKVATARRTASVMRFPTASSQPRPAMVTSAPEPAAARLGGAHLGGMRLPVVQRCGVLRRLRGHGRGADQSIRS